jgi:sortase (surface protein transpeptidase)
MWRPVRLPVLALLAAGALAAASLAPAGAQDSGSHAPEAGLARQLHYISRDPLTGMGSTVGDRFIAAVEESFETYYAEDREPIPPPELTGPAVTRLEIPALGVSAAVASYGLDRAGRLDVPQDNATVGWNPGFTSTPGSGGSTFFAAHYEYLGSPGVFHELSSLQPGDEILVTLSDGAVLRYAVTSTIDYALATIDMGAILAGREGVESLTLMTCSGPGDGGRYPLRTVVLAEAEPG